jgi:hypothetical protein
MVNYIVLNVWVSGSSRMVGHLPHHPKVKVLRSVSITGKGREEMVKFNGGKCFYTSGTMVEHLSHHPKVKWVLV